MPKDRSKERRRNQRRTATAVVTTPAPLTPGGSSPYSKQARIEAHRAEARRRTRIRLALLGVAAAGALTVVLWAAGVGQPDLGEAAPSEGGVGEHVAQGQPLTYRNRPPSSGPHYASRASYGVTTRPVEVGNWVHALEHGAIVVLYKCTDDCEAIADQLREQVYEPARAGRFGERKLVIAPYDDMDAPFTAVAWGRVLELDTLDAEQILAFYNRYLDRGPEDAA